MIIRFFAAAALSVIALHGAASAETPSPDVWDLRPLYDNDGAWIAESKAFQADLAEVVLLKGTLGESAASLCTALDHVSALRRRLDRLVEYASLKADEDARVAETQARAQAARALETKFDEMTSFVIPEVIGLGRGKIENLIASEDGLAKHRYQLEDMLHKADHVLTPDGEELLASTGNLRELPGRIRSALVYGEMPWPTIRLGEEEVLANEDGYNAHREDPDRASRRQVFESYWTTFSHYEKTLGAALDAHLEGAAFEAKGRRYPNALSLALDANRVPESVYRTLIKETNDALPTLHRYLALRKRLFDLPELRYWDMNPPLANGTKVYSLAEAEQLVLDAVAPLGPQYHRDLAAGFASHSMHSRPQPGKQGTYMMGLSYDVHPYVLLNFDGSYDGLSSLAHEWGHAMHTVLADRAQPYETSRYKIFAAEIPSTANEMLLADYVIASSSVRAEKIVALSRALELLRKTFFRQAMLAEFELAAHEAVERGDGVTGGTLTSIYLALLKHYYGDGEGGVKIDDLFGVEWASIPHFYNDFYVYQYATSIAAAAYFVDGLERGDVQMRGRYFKMLEAGGAGDAYTLIKSAGVDLATPGPYRALVRRMDRLMDQLEAALSEKS